jgi:hypothetical protein
MRAVGREGRGDDDTATRRRLGRPYRIREGLVQHLSFSPDGTTLALTTYAGRTLVDLIDPRTGERQQRFRLPRFPEPAAYILAPVVFQPNGRDLVVEQTDLAFPDRPGSLLWRLTARTGAVEQPPLRVGRHAAWNLVTTADRRRLFVTSAGDDETYAIAAGTLRVLRTYPAGGLAGAARSASNSSSGTRRRTTASPSPPPARRRRMRRATACSSTVRVAYAASASRATAPCTPRASS